MRVLIAPDKFKGTLTARDAAESIARGWKKVRPQDRLDLLPISDGGDGFGEVLGDLLDAKVQTIKTVDAAHRSCKARWWWEPKSKTAIIESANVIGLAMLPPGKFHPFELDTFGLGAVIRAASRKGARRCIIGIGGSATNDGGFGLARALGWKFWDADEELIEQWTDLHRLARVQTPKFKKLFDEIIVAVDVWNPLLGARGATRVYGPQKGLKNSELTIAERNLKRLADVVSQGFGVPASAGAGRLKAELRTLAGAGAAGGLGFGLHVFLGAKLESGFDLFTQFSKLDARLRSVDLVITGEGRLDESTLMGKGVGEIAQCCRRLKIPCVALAGQISERAKLKKVFTGAFDLMQITSERNAKAKPRFWLERLAVASAMCADFRATGSTLQTRKANVSAA